MYKPDLDDKILISYNIKIKENKSLKLKIIEKNKVKKENIINIILGEIIKIHGAETYDVLISKDYIDFNLKKMIFVELQAIYLKLFHYHLGMI